MLHSLDTTSAINLHWIKIPCKKITSQNGHSEVTKHDRKKENDRRRFKKSTDAIAE